MTNDLRLLPLLAALALAGCPSDEEKLAQAKQCTDAGLIPHVYVDGVECHFPEKSK